MDEPARRPWPEFDPTVLRVEPAVPPPAAPRRPGPATIAMGVVAAVLVAAVVVAGVLVVRTLRAGTTPDNPITTPVRASNPVTTPAPGAATGPLDDVTVSGPVGEVPTIAGPWPLRLAASDVRVLDPGTGPEIGSDATVAVRYVMVNARTGSVVDTQFDDAIEFAMTETLTGFRVGLQGQRVGSRVLLGISAADGYDPDGFPEAGIEPGDGLVAVVEIIAVS